MRLDVVADQFQAELEFDALFVAGISMCILANSYFQVGRRQDALLLREKALEFQRRVLPDNHPDIGAT